MLLPASAQHKMPTKHIYCCICSNHANKTIDGEKVTMHRFTSDPVKRKIWIKRCRLVRKDFKFTSYGATRICGKHFVGGKGPTKEHNIPSVFPTKTFQISNFSSDVSFSQLEIPETDDATTDENEIQANMVEEELDQDESDTEILSCNTFLDTSVTMHDYCSAAPKLLNIRTQSTQTPILKTFESTGTQTDFSMWFSDCSSQTDHSIFKSVAEQGTEVDRPTLTYEDIKDNDDKVLFYTGIPNSNIFEALFDEIKADAADNTGRKQTMSDRKKNDSEKVDENGNLIFVNEVGRPRILRLIDEFLLVLMRLRLGLLLEDLADRFRISIMTCGTIFNKWIDYLDVQFEFLVKWPSRVINKETMPQSFQCKYPNCRVIIDCTEIRTETPTSLQLKSAMYSDYKSHMTFKALVGINPAGVVTFVS